MPNTQSRVIRETPNMSRQTSVLEGMRIWEEGYKKLHWKCVANAREVYGKCSCPRLTKALEMVLVQAWAEKSWNLSLPGFGLGTPPKKKLHSHLTTTRCGILHWKKRDSHHSHSLLVVVFNFCLQVTILQALYLQNLIRIRTMPGGNEAKV